jgi:hypothetical protein
MTYVHTSCLFVQNQAQLQPPQQQQQQQQQHHQQVQQQQAYGQLAPAPDVKSEAKAPQTPSRQPLHQQQQQPPVSPQQQHHHQQQQQQGADLPLSLPPLQQQPQSQAQLAYQLPGMFEGESCWGLQLPMSPMLPVQLSRQIAALHAARHVDCCKGALCALSIC